MYAPVHSVEAVLGAYVLRDQAYAGDSSCVGSTACRVSAGELSAGEGVLQGCWRRGGATPPARSRGRMAAAP